MKIKNASPKTHQKAGQRKSYHLPWMDNRSLRRFISVLEKAGGQVYFVGGCVRNLLLEDPLTDVDVATDLWPKDVMSLSAKNGFRALPTGERFGTVTIMIGKMPLEVTTLRRDIKTDGRHAEVAFTPHILEDAKRRDFTINALYLKPTGELCDPLGGIGDLKARRVRFVGEPHERITEDFLRILRFFRFHGTYGRGSPDARGLKACEELASGIERLSGERIIQEWLKILSLPKAPALVKLMYQQGILGPLYQPGFDLVALKRLVIFEGALKNPEAFRRLSLVVSHEARVWQRLRLSTADQKRLAFLKERQLDPWTRQATDKKALRYIAYRWGKVGATDTVYIAHAKGYITATMAQKALRYLETYKIPIFPIKGARLLKQGYRPGPALGEKLADLERRFVESDFTLTVRELLA